jgi:transglutaminase-like putative cysteine protease
VPIVNQLGTTELVARDYETTSLLEGDRRLLRIDCSLRLPGAQPLASVVWVDNAGEILKTLTPGVDQVNYRTTREVALAETAGPALDLGTSTSIRLAAPIPHAHETTLIRYRVELADGDPAQAFPQGSSQQVRSLGPHLAEVTVRAIRPSDVRVAGPQPAAANDLPPNDADRAPSPLVQSDDPLVLELAREAAGDERDPWRTSVRLEQFVKQTIRSKNFSQAFSSAGEVARTREGDCTEHAVLLAAMARARGIPARVAMGLVYTEPPAGEPMLAFHMWTEVSIGGRWIPLDATLGHGGIGAAHLKLAQSSLAGADAMAGFLPIAQVLGRLQVSVLSAQ